MILVTGATGYIGEQLVRQLLADGVGPIRILVRSEEKARRIYGALVEQLSLAQGDLGNPDSLDRALAVLAHVLQPPSRA